MNPNELITSVLEGAVARFEQDNPHLVPLDGGIEEYESAVSLQRNYLGTHTLTLTCAIEPIANTASKARMRAVFHDADSLTNKSRSRTGYLYLTDGGWQLTFGKNKTVKVAEEASRVFDFLAGF